MVSALRASIPTQILVKTSLTCKGVDERFCFELVQFHNLYSTLLHSHMTSSSCTVSQFQSLFLTISLLIGRQKLDIAGCPWPVLLCTYFCERQQTTADQSFDVLPQYVRGYNAVMIMLLTFVNLQ